MRRLFVIVLLSISAMLAAATAAQAVVVDMGAAGHLGVALVPGTRADLGAAGVSPVTSSPPCTDPWLSSDLVLPSIGLCWHPGGAVMRGNETFAITWDPVRRYWSTSRDYVEKFLKNVANGSHTLTSPYAVTTQYKDGPGTGARAGNASVYGGGCIDYGNPGGATCTFNNAIGSGVGRNYPASSSCPVSGSSYTFANDRCVTDSDIQHELSAMVNEMGLVNRTPPGHTPLLMVLMPPGVETCLNASGTLCSVGSTAPARFCSYHSHLSVGGTQIAYAVQPWTPHSTCDESDLDPLPPNPTPTQLATDAGVRLVSPVSEGQIASIVNPWLNSWFALDGSEITDNRGCVPFGKKVDTVTVGSGSYVLQREFNNAGVIQTDPNAPDCAPLVNLAPTFVAPSPINAGDVVAFDGSTTVSSLIVPKDNYVWNFGDGTTGVGPSVVHSYAKGGTYVVKLSVVDRGGNIASFSQTVPVLGSGSQPPPPPPHHHHHHHGLSAHLQLMPQGLKTLLRFGLAMRVSSNEPADAIATLSISRQAAAQAHIPHGRGATVVIGRGSIRGIKDGTVKLHLMLSRSVAAKLRHLRHVAVTVRLALFASGGDHIALDAAGRY